MRKVTFVRLHTVVHTPLTGQLSDVFPPVNKSLDNLTMSEGEHGIDISFSLRGIKHNLTAPYTNVIGYTWTFEEKSTPALKVAK